MTLYIYGMKQLQFIFVLAALLAAMPATGQKKIKHDQVVTISTSFGEMILVLYDETPKHKANFLRLVEDQYYDGTTFHRVIKNFMIQGGDPSSREGGDASQIGMGGPGYTIDAEILGMFKHKKGALAAARMGDAANPKRASSGSQFYIVHNENGTPHLDGAYTVFGQVIQGLEVVDAIANQAVGSASRPEVDIRMMVTAKKMKRKKITKMYGHAY